jgi:membrane protease subunit HflK
MGWNEPGGRGNGPRDPWGGGGGNQGPPDLDEVIRNLKDKFKANFGGGGGGRGSGSGGGAPSMNPAPLIGIIVAVLLVVFGAWGIFQVDESERAVVTRFGKFDRIVNPGLNWHTPLYENYYKANVTQTSSYQVQQDMLTRDTNIVFVDLEVQYRVVDPKAYLLRIARPTEALENSTESALRHVVGNSSINDVLRDERETIGIAVEERLQEYLDRYNTGFTVVNVALNETAAPEPVRDAFNDVARAREDQQRFKKEAQAYANSIIPEAQGKAVRIREEARAYREEIVSRAQGDTRRFKQLLTEYQRAPRVTRERLYLETLEDVMGKTGKVMVDVEGGQNMMYLPLDKITQKHRRSGASGAGSGSSGGSSSSSSSSSSGTGSGGGSAAGADDGGSLYNSSGNTEIR